MNTKHVIALAAAGGALIGSGVTWFIARRKARKEQREEQREESNAYADDFPSIRRAFADAFNGSFKDAKEAPKPRVYNDYDRDNGAERAVKAEPVSDTEPLGPIEAPGEETDAYAIGVADFMQDATYRKSFVRYYRADGALVDGDTGTELDVREHLGEMADILALASDSLKVAYVRNTRTATDYEVELADGAYGGDEDE